MVDVAINCANGARDKVGVWFIDENDLHDDGTMCPYGVPGNRLWVKEAWRAEVLFDGHRPRDLSDNAGLAYEAGRHVVKWPAAMGKLRPSISMPRWAGCITLEVTSINVERLQEISEVDARAEGLIRFKDDWCNGVDSRWYASPVGACSGLWEQINGAGSWDLNTWLWAVEFRRIKSGISCRRSRREFSRRRK